MSPANLTLGPLEVGEADTFGVRVRQAVAHAHPQSHALGVDMETKYRVALVYECEPGSARAYAALFANSPELLEALEDMTPHMPPKNAMCHIGIVPQEQCHNCQRIARARAVIAKVRGVR